MREAVGVLQLHHAVGQQPQRPHLPSVRRRAAGQRDQMRFRVAVELARGGTGGVRTPLNGRRDALADKAAAHVIDEAGADVESLDDWLIGELIGGSQQDPDACEAAGTGLARIFHTRA